jgi:hypothetical protein
MTKIEVYRIGISVGKVCCIEGTHPLNFLSNKEMKDFDEIGYTGGLEKEGIKEKITKVEYLNSLGKGLFTVDCLKYDNGNFYESFLIVRVLEVEEANKSHIKFCVAYTLANNKNQALAIVGDGDVMTYNKKAGFVDMFANFEEEEQAKVFYNEVLKIENLYTANFCKVIETTG